MTTTLFLNERRDEEGVVAVGGYCGYEAVTCLAAQNGRDTPPGRVMPGGGLEAGAPASDFIMVIPTVYVKPGCPWCEEVVDFFGAHGLSFREVVVTGNREAMAEMVALSGQTKAPTMDWDGEVLADFGVDELIPFLRRKGVAV